MQRIGPLSAYPSRRHAGASASLDWATRLLAGLLWLLGGLLAAGCATLPPPQGRVASSAFADTGDTRLGRQVAPMLDAHAGLSGLHAMPDGYDAFAARIGLAAAAERSLDLQYFIWHEDQVGWLMFEALWQAAERGVRVRLLLDDGGTTGIDTALAALDAHARIEVRLYNPFAQRASRALGYLGDFRRLNRRMHNKSFTADNQASVVGGRNIANAYFGAAGAIGFADLDVLMIGPVVPQVSAQFDLYWNSASAYPAADFVGAAPAHAQAMLRARFTATHAEALAQDYLKAVRDSAFVHQLLDRSLELEWTTAKLLHDSPAKTLDRDHRTDVLLFPVLMQRLGRPAKSFDIVTPYFVPGDDGTAVLTALARSGVRVRVLTNSLASSDERIVHAGYVKRRRELLGAGVQLFELKPDANRQALRVQGRFGAGKVAGLHAKVYAVDGERLFVGSFNFDQRSARLNTELGVVIDSRLGAAQVAEMLDADARVFAYELRLTPDGRSLVWIDRDAQGNERLHDADPGTGWGQRLVIGLLSGLPIDWLL